MSWNRYQKKTVNNSIKRDTDASYIGVECNEQYFKAKEGICVDLSIPGSIPYGKDAPKTQLMPETKEIFEAPLCGNNGYDIMKKFPCGCDVGSTSVKLDDKGRHRGNCSG